uniref:SPIN-DOC-like zinc-finger domain-containing protein n=1 Tax=Dicentrarchus labrax TaxID=13489 RepID=A0A8P4KFQ5_DICLA
SSTTPKTSCKDAVMERGRQWHCDKRKFKKTWEHEYFFTEIDSVAVCLICKQRVGVLKEYNIRRHHETRHSHQFSKYSGEERKVKAGDLLPSTEQENATRASYHICSLIVRSGLPFAVGDFVKQCLTVAADTVCPNQTFSHISLSQNTVTRRVEDMAEDIRGQIVQRAGRFSAFSIACDESTDISDSAQLLVFLRGVNEDFEVCQELAGLETLKGTTKGTDVFMAVQLVMDRNSLKWEKKSGITTDGAPAMVGKRAGLTALVSDKVRKFGGSVLKYHCILHQEQLCAKSIGLKNVMQDVVVIVNNIRSKALSHRQFKALLDEMDAQYGDVLYHQEVRWLSRGKVLRRFLTAEELQMELLELQVYSDLHSKFRELTLQDFYRRVPAHRYAKIRKHAQVMLSLFGSTYVCEQAFSLLNLNKCKLRNALSDSHLHDILTLSVSQLEPDVETLLKTKGRLHVSH